MKGKKAKETQSSNAPCLEQQMIQKECKLHEKRYEHRAKILKRTNLAYKLPFSFMWNVCTLPLCLFLLLTSLFYHLTWTKITYEFLFCCCFFFIFVFPSLFCRIRFYISFSVTMNGPGHVWVIFYVTVFHTFDYNPNIE